MVNNNFSAKENKEFERMIALMNYGRVDESKPAYSGIENTKVGADGKTYGIIREGAKFYIKVSDKKNPLVEDFDYIGGFRNHKDYEYESFANAQKNLDMKLRSVNEAFKTPEMVVESWENKGENNQTITESTKRMQSEIARQREIMENVNLIGENKTQKLAKLYEKENCECAPFCENPDKEFKDMQNDNIKGEKAGNGDAKKANKDYKDASLKDTDINENEVLAFNRDNDDYMDKSHGTEIGDTAPFDKGTDTDSELKNGVVEEGESMHDTDNQNSPKPGTGEIGDTAPFDGEKGKEIDEAIDDLENDVDAEDGDDLDLGDEEGFDTDNDVDGIGDEEGAIDDVEGDIDDVEDGIDDVEADDEIIDDEEESLETRMDQLEDLMSRIAKKLGVNTYEDENLYDGEDDEEVTDIDDTEDEPVGDNGDDYELEMNGDEEEPIEDCMTYESKAYRAMKLRESQMRRRRAINEENRLDDFGKHPAFQKKVMTLPKTNQTDKEGYYDMNDDSVKSDAPYATKIGDDKPFEIDPEAITNAIAESIKNILKKK